MLNGLFVIHSLSWDGVIRNIDDNLHSPPWNKINKR